MIPTQSLSRKGQTWPDRIWNILSGRKTFSNLHPISAGLSDIGGRAENQDRCYRNDNAAVYLVIDGMGGHQGGSLASDIAVDTLSEFLLDAARNADSMTEMGVVLHDALEVAHRAMHDAADVNPSYSKMGCTLAAVAVVNDRAFYTRIGDSRVYLLHDGKIKRLTTDETLVEELIAARLIASSEVSTHRWRHVVTNSLSARGIEKEPQWQELTLCDGDQILLTSDGLTDTLTDTEIEDQVSQSDSPEHCVKSLVQKALSRDAKDNVTCVVTKMESCT